MSKEHGALSSTVGKGALINIAGDILGASGPLFLIAITRLRGSELLGLFISASYYFAILLRLAVTGHDKGVLRFVPMVETRGGLEAVHGVLTSALRWTITVAFGVMLLTCIACGGVILAGIDEPNHDLYFWMVVFSLALPTHAVAMVTMYAVRGRSRMKPYVLVHNVAIPASFVVLALPALFESVDRLMLAGAFVGASWIGGAVALVLFRRNFPEFEWRSVLRPKQNKELAGFSLPQGFTEMLNFLLARVDVLMLATFFPDRRELAAYYGIAGLLAAFVKKVRFAFDNSFSPVLAGLIAKGDIPNLERQYQEVARWIFSLFAVMAVGLSFGAPFVLGVYGSEYVPYWPLVPLLIAGRFFNVAGGPAQAALLMSGRSKLELANNIAINATNIALNWWLIQKYDVYGAALATAISLTVFNIIRIVEVRILLRIRARVTWVFGVGGAAVFAAIPCGLLVARAPFDFGLLNFAALSFFVVAYPALLWLFGFKDDVRRILDLLHVKKKGA